MTASLTPTLATWTICWAPINASKWRMGFNSTFKGLRKHFFFCLSLSLSLTFNHIPLRSILIFSFHLKCSFTNRLFFLWLVYNVTPQSIVFYFIWQLHYYPTQTVSLDRMELSDRFGLGPRVLVRCSTNKVLLFCAMYNDSAGDVQ